MSTNADKCEGDLNNQLFQLVQQVKVNYQCVLKEWEDMKNKLHDEKEKTDANKGLYMEDANAVVVARPELARLERETAQLKKFLPKVLSNEYLKAYARLDVAEEELHVCGQKIEDVTSEREHWKSRCENALAEVEKEKEEKFGLRVDLQELSQQLSQQSEYCASMGAACCTLLWRVSRCEDSIQAILAGCKVDEFLGMVSSTLDSYLQTYKEDVPQDTTEETQFILALCGIITNIAASPIGRDFLTMNEHGHTLIDVFMKVLYDAPSKKCSKMKVLILMSLYNLTINKKGLQYISAKQGVIGLIVWLLQEESDAELKLNCLRLIQSMLYEQQSPKLLHEANEVITSTLLHELSMDMNKDVREASLELANDLKYLNTE